MANVYIAIPSRSHWSPHFGMSLIQAVMNSKPHGICVVNRSSSLVHANRQKLCEMAMKQDGVTHILFLDDDMSFPPDTIRRLVAHDKPVVAASYVKRELPIAPLCYGLDDQPIDSFGKTGIEEVKAVATGCMLINVDVLHGTPLPWFNTAYVEETGGFQGEDIWFCLAAREHGFGVWVDHDLSLQVRHWGELGYHFALSSEAD